MLKRIIFYFTLCAGMAATLFACEAIVGPDFPDTPEISFQSVRKFRIQKLGNATDSVSIAVKFWDGDGDLGISNEEIGLAPFEKEVLVPDGQGGFVKVPNRLYYNYYVQAFRKTNGEYVPFEAIPTLSGHFPILNEGKKGPIEGTLYYGPLFFIGFSPPNDTLRFEVYILDRAGNQSNAVMTDDVIINER